MTIRTKILIIIGLWLLLMPALLYVTSRFTFIQSLEEIEASHSTTEVERALSAFSYITSDLETLTAGWAYWDDTYTFIEDRNDDYIKSNLVDDTFITLQLNLILYIDSSGQIIYGKAFDLDEEEETAIPEALTGQLSDTTSPLLDKLTGQSVSTGIIPLPKYPLLFSAQPILTSEGEGPIRGTLVFARYVDSVLINKLNQIFLYPVSLLPLSDVDDPEFKKILPSLLAEDSVFISPTSSQYITGYSIIRDVFGRPSIVLRIELPRDIYQLGQTAVSYYIYTILGLGLLVAVIIIVLLQTQVLSRLTRLLRGVDNIATSGDTSERISLTGNDELNVIASTINGMLGALEESTAEIREREERYRDLFENTTDLIQSVTPDGQFIYVNNAWLEVLGYKQEEIESLELWDIIHPESIPAFKEIIERITPDKSTANIESVFIGKGNKSIVLNGNISFQFKDGKAIAVRGIFHDVTERKQAEERLTELYRQERELREQLEEEIQKRTEFTRALVHELRTPITPVLAATELLLEEIDDERLLKLVQSIDRSASNLNRRIEELLDLARGETDMIQLVIEPVDPLLLLREIGQEMAPVADGNNQSLTVDLPSSIPTILADRGRLRQIVMNLLNNAFKYTPPKGKITLKAKVEDTNLVVEIQDTGLGITEEDQKRLFEPYYRRVEDRERLSGLGLGLALAKNFVELHGGKIWVKSTKRRGSTFGFSIPIDLTNNAGNNKE